MERKSCAGDAAHAHELNRTMNAPEKLDSSGSSSVNEARNDQQASTANSRLLSLGEILQRVEINAGRKALRYLQARALLHCPNQSCVVFLQTHRWQTGAIVECRG